MLVILAVATAAELGLVGILAIFAPQSRNENGKWTRLGITRVVLAVMALVTGVSSAILQERSVHLHSISRISISAVFSLPNSDLDSALSTYLPTRSGAVTINAMLIDSTKEEPEPKWVAAVRNPLVGVRLVFLKKPKNPGDKWKGYKENDLEITFGNAAYGEGIREEHVASDVSFDADWNRVRIDAQFEPADSSGFERTSDLVENIEDLAGSQIVLFPSLDQRISSGDYDPRVSQVLQRAQLERFSLKLNNGPEVTLTKAQFREFDGEYFYNFPASISVVKEKFVGRAH